jgi:hypothetical protein
VPQDEDNERPSRGGKVISLRSHQAAEAALDELVQAQRDGEDYLGLVGPAATLGPPILAAVMRRLDSRQPQLLTLFRHLIERYPIPSQAEEALLRAASDTRSGDGKRLGALLLLYDLGFQVPATHDFLSSLHSPSSSLAQALASILGDLEARPSATDDYASYLMSLLSLPVDFLYSALTALSSLEEKEGAIAALRVLALYPHPDLTAGAVEVLCSRPSEARMKALSVLEPNLPPESALVVSRTLYKARLSGAHDVDRLLVSDDQCKAMLSGIDAQGRRLMWLNIPVAREQVMTRTVRLTLDDESGLLDVSDSQETSFPVTPPTGTLPAPIISEGFDMNADSYAVSCLEVPFGYGLQVLRDAVRLNWETGTPLSMQYLLLFHLIWQYGAAENKYNRDQEAVTPREDDPYFDAQVDLLSNTEISGWYLQTVGTRLLAEEIVRASPGPYRPGEESWRMLLPSLIRLAREEFGQKRRALYARRLRLMSEWMRFAGREREAGLCASAARTMLESPPEANLIVLQLIQKGILVDLDEMGFLDARGPETYSH